MSSANVLAKAIYDNIAETADELEFHRGDIVTVIEQNTADLEGWWLCSLNGRQGIAPGNRLRLIPMTYSTTPQQTLHQAKDPIDDEDDEYDVPKHQYTNLNNNNNDPDDVYDVPTARNWGSKQDLDEDEVYDVPPPPSLQASLLLKSSNENLLSSSPHHRTIQIEQEVYDIPSNLVAPGSSNVSHADDAYDPSEVYDVPTNREGDPEEVYDVPLSNKVADAMQLDVSAMLEQAEEEDEVYDVPPYRAGNDSVDGIIPGQQTSTPVAAPPDSPDIVYDVPKASQRALELSAMERSLNLSNISMGSTPNARQNTPKRLEKQQSDDYVYDVPPQVTRDQPPPSTQWNKEKEVLDGVIKRLSLVDNDGNWQERKSTSSVESISSIIAAHAKYTELNIEHASAIDLLIKLKQSLEDSVSTLLTHVYEGWREKENISGKIGVIKEVFELVLSSVSKFVDFARGSMANANAAYERGLSIDTPRKLISGMHKLLQPLEEDNMMLQQANNALEQACWSLSKLVSSDKNPGVPDEIDSFVMTSRAVSDDSRQVAAYIHTHSQYLFKQVESKVNPAQRRAEIEQERKVIQTRPLPDVPPTQQQQLHRATVNNGNGQNVDNWLEDYDYVSLEEQEEIGSSPKVIGISNEVRKRHKEILQVLEMSNQKQGIPIIMTKEFGGTNDHFTLQELVEDVPVLVDSLVSAIKQFYASVDNGDPPKTFVSLSKQVILCAHELVFFGDTLYRRLNNKQMQEMVKGHCTELCTSLKRTVASTKHATQQWPSVNAVQEMVDKVTDITASAHQFRVLLSQCSIR